MRPDGKVLFCDGRIAKPCKNAIVVQIQGPPQNFDVKSVTVEVMRFPEQAGTMSMTPEN